MYSDSKSLLYRFPTFKTLHTATVTKTEMSFSVIQCSHAQQLSFSELNSTESTESKEIVETYFYLF